MARTKSPSKPARPSHRTARWVLTGKNAESIFNLKITLAGSKPKIWRQIEISSYYTLDDLHVVIQIAMGWEECHLHQFIVDRERRYGPPSPQDFAMFADDKLLNSESITLAALEKELKKGIQYEYDFGDSWVHEIKLIKSRPLEKKDKHKPICLAGENACPPEDCGGIFGYYDMLAAIKNPKHEMHGDYTDWLDTEFDPTAFDMKKVNRELKRASQ